MVNSDDNTTACTAADTECADACDRRVATGSLKACDAMAVAA